MYRRKNAPADAGREDDQIKLGMRLEIGIQSQFGHIGAASIGRSRIADEESIENLGDLARLESGRRP